MHSSLGGKTRLFAVAFMMLLINLVVPPITATAAETDPPAETVRPISYRSSTSATVHEATWLDLRKPGHVVGDDLLLARLAVRNRPDATLSAPTGWQLVRTDQTADGLTSWLFWKVDGGSEPAAYRFKINSRADLVGTMTAFDGVDTKNPILTKTGQANADLGSFEQPAMITTARNGVVVWFGTQNWTGGTCEAIVQPDGFRELGDSCLQSANGIAYETAYGRLTVAGSQAAFVGSSPYPRSNISQSVVLRPDPNCACGDDYTSTVNVLGKVTEPALIEPSGLGASRINPGVLYTHGEDNPTMLAINGADASVVGNYQAGIVPWDWEDIAVGPCPTGSCVFMADIGKESGRPGPQPTQFAVYRMPEPDLARGENSGTLTGVHFRFEYPDGAKNAEALMVHPVTGDIYVLTKANSTGISEVYRFPDKNPEPESLSVLTHVATLHLPISSTDGVLGRVTAAAIHPCGDRFLVRTYHAVYEFRAPAGGSFADAFAAPPVPLTDTKEGQGESIEYAADGSGYFTMSEAGHQPYTLKFVAQRTD